MRFVVKGIPTKRRARFRKTGMAYVDGKTRAEEKAIASCYGGPKLGGGVSVEVDIYPKLPKATPKKISRQVACKKPDVDNVLKVVMDALKGVAYDDDKQVTHARATRHEMERIDTEHIVVTVLPNGEEHETEQDRQAFRPQGA